jgi:RNA polymerase sigma factor (sigma-70 family)
MTDTEFSRSGGDAAAVAAVRAGEIDKYGELVERHARRVFAVAWSRLGDRTLAEEAAQEAFVRGYRKLCLLGDGQKFGSWIAAIARNVSINLGMRERRELNKREQWALERVDEESAEPHAETPTTGETLRETLEGLQARHRECLVLFYVEKKSGAEAAAALGISEAAFRVRLHRARAELREQLDLALADSLRGLGPSRGFTTAVMAALAASSTAKVAAGGFGTAVASGAAKVLPVSWLVSFISWVPILQVPFMAWLYTRAESRNFRDPDGFRPRLLRAAIWRRFLWLFPLMVLLWWTLPRMQILFGPRLFFLVIGVLCVVFLGASIRLLAINRTRYFKVSVLGTAWLTLITFAVGFGAFPVTFVWAAILPTMLLSAWVFGERPVRMDYNLFLRALEGLLAPGSGEQLEPPRARNKSDLLRFARFLGERWLVTDYRWTKVGLRLRVTHPTGLRWGLFEFFRREREASYIILSLTGTVSATLPERDRLALERQRGSSIPNVAGLEHQVSTALTRAWRAFDHGETGAAEAALGEASESQVFKVSPRRSGLTRWHQRLTIGFATLALISIPFLYFQPPWMSGLVPGQASEAEARAALARFDPEHPQYHRATNRLTSILMSWLVTPNSNLFTPAALAGFRAETRKISGAGSTAVPEVRIGEIAQSWLLQRALTEGVFSYEDLGVTRASLAEHLGSGAPYFVEHLLTSRSCRGTDGEYTMQACDRSALPRLQMLRDLDRLDLINRQKLIEQIAAVQVRSGEATAERPALSNWKDLRGLFIIPDGRALEDTYTHLAGLEILGGLDRIDREACIRAILKLHRGRGYFLPPETTEKWRLHIRGEASDTYAAFRSLQILGALDRVKDLAQWEFRFSQKKAKKENADGLTWAELEAWLLKEHFERLRSP